MKGVVIVHNHYNSLAVIAPDSQDFNEGGGNCPHPL